MDLFVSPEGLHHWPYTNWTDAATNVQAAVDAAQSGDNVWVTNGIYTVSSAVALTNGITVTSVNGRDTVIIDAQGLTRGVFMDHPDAVLRGIGVANGWSPQFGGGILCLRGRVEDCLVRNSEAFGAGGIACGSGGVIADSVIASNIVVGLDSGGAAGILCNGGRVERCTVRDNTAVNGIAGGVGLTYSGVLVESTVTGNLAAYGAGVASMMGGRVDRCTITGNTADELAGGLWVWEGDATSSVIAGNRAKTGGGAYIGPIPEIGASGGMYFAASRLINCTVAANTAQSSAGGVMCSSNALVQNSIIWTNAAPLFANVATSALETVFLYTCTTPLLPGTGNITNTPQLTPSYRLKSTSPCIDAGTDSNAPPTDIDGEARWDHPGHSNVISIVDIGADEFVDTDLDNMADYWETEAFGSVTNRDGTADADADTLNDLDEYNNSTTSTSPDTDADQMPDGWEVTHALDPLADDAQGDADADAMHNLGEYIADTDPHDSGSFLGLLDIRPEVGGMRIDWHGGRDAWQFLETSTDLRATNWAAIYGLPPPTPSTNAVIHLGPTNQILFYRIRALR